MAERLVAQQREIHRVGIAIVPTASDTGETTHLVVVHHLYLGSYELLLLAQVGHIDVLVNNAGYGFFGAVENVPIDDARNQLEVNVFGLARLCQLVLPSMREHKSGRIINVASVAGHMSMTFGSL